MRAGEETVPPAPKCAAAPATPTPQMSFTAYKLPAALAEENEQFMACFEEIAQRLEQLCAPTARQLEPETTDLTAACADVDRVLQRAAAQCCVPEVVEEEFVEAPIPRAMTALIQHRCQCHDHVEAAVELVLG